MTDNGESQNVTERYDVAEWADVSVTRLRALVGLLYPDDMTPNAKRLILQACDEAVQEMVDLEAEMPPTPSLEALGFTKVGTCAECGVDAFVTERWAHFGQDGIDHPPVVDPASVRDWPSGGPEDA